MGWLCTSLITFTSLSGWLYGMKLYSGMQWIMGKRLRRGDFNFCEAVWFHYKKIDYRSGESYDMTYEILKG